VVEGYFAGRIYGLVDDDKNVILGKYPVTGRGELSYGV